MSRRGSDNVWKILLWESYDLQLCFTFSDVHFLFLSWVYTPTPTTPHYCWRKMTSNFQNYQPLSWLKMYRAFCNSLFTIRSRPSALIVKSDWMKTCVCTKHLHLVSLYVAYRLPCKCGAKTSLGPVHVTGDWSLNSTIQWSHNEQGGVSNHQPLSGHRSKKTSQLRVTGLCEGNSPVTGEFAAQRASNAENVSIWWRHHVISFSYVWW